MSFFASIFGNSDLEIEGATALQMVDEGAQLLDVREREERVAGHARSDIHIPLGDIAGEAGKKLAKTQPVVVYCRSGMRSLNATNALRGQGFEAYSLKGGFPTWVNAGGSCA